MAEPYAHIACCLDGSPAGDAALAAAIRTRSLGDGALTLVHVLEPGISTYTGYRPDEITDDLHDARSWMEQMVAMAPGSQGVLLEGHPATATVEWAREAGADLLVAVRHRGAVEHLLLGSFAQHLAYNSPCTVMLVHPPGAGG
ncbi:MAG: universal stress protein [Actinobacteria bacterium]|nr:universal stress protein [Actinomycetota bacterium]